MNAFIGKLNPNIYAEEQIVFTDDQIIEQQLIRTTQHAHNLFSVVMQLMQSANPDSIAYQNARNVLNKIKHG